MPLALRAERKHYARDLSNLFLPSEPVALAACGDGRMLATAEASDPGVKEADKQSRSSAAMRSFVSHLLPSFRKLVLTSLPRSL